MLGSNSPLITPLMAPLNYFVHSFPCVYAPDFIDYLRSSFIAAQIS